MAAVDYTVANYPTTHVFAHELAFDFIVEQQGLVVQ
jgi:hypothetical protein